MRGLPGRPRDPRIGQIASTVCSSIFESWTLAAECSTPPAQRRFGLPQDGAWRALFAPISRIQPGLFAPPGTASTAAESTDAREQSIWSAFPPEPLQQSARCAGGVLPHTGLVCHSSRGRQSRSCPSRRAHLLGEHLPGDGRLEHEEDAPVSAARSGRRGLAPLGLGGSSGKSGSSTSHSSSVTSGLAMVASYPIGGFC